MRQRLVDLDPHYRFAIDSKVGGTCASNAVKQHVHCACRDMSAHLLHVAVLPLPVDCVELHVKTFYILALFVYIID